MLECSPIVFPLLDKFVSGPVKEIISLYKLCCITVDFLDWKHYVRLLFRDVYSELMKTIHILIPSVLMLVKKNKQVYRHSIRKGRFFCGESVLEEK